MKTAHDSEVPAHGQQVITACAFIHQNFMVSQSGGLMQEVACDFDARKNHDNLNSDCKFVEKLFLPRRALTKKFLQGVFELPGGHIDFGENLVAGLKREIQEEFGMDIEVGDPFAAFDYKNEIKGSHSIEVVYFARFVDPIVNIKLDPEDHSDFIWFDGSDYTLLEEGTAHPKGSDDPEVINIKKGFELLSGESLRF